MKVLIDGQEYEGTDVLVLGTEKGDTLTVRESEGFFLSCKGQAHSCNFVINNCDITLCKNNMVRGEPFPPEGVPIRSGPNTFGL